MSDSKGSTVLVVETEKQVPSFLDDKIDLKRLAREISKASSAAVDVLVKLLESKDEKIRLEAAKKLVEFQVEVAKEISHDQLQRLIAEIKLVRGPTKLVDASNGGNGPRPLVDFSTIREVA